MADEVPEALSPRRSLELQKVDELGGFPLLHVPWLNKNTAFTAAERRRRNLEGLLPPCVETLDEQSARLMYQLSQEPSDLHRNTLLMGVLSSNMTLFYKAVVDNVSALAPIVYTPTIGEACQTWDVNFREPIGMYLSAFHHRGRFEQVLRNWPAAEVQIAVVTDGSRILGLGDLGVNGIGIPIGKAALYVAAAGFHPEKTLPIVLDVGCDRAELREHVHYLGARRPRLDGDEYFAVLAEFVAAFKAAFPGAVLQFEDFATPKALRLLAEHRGALPCFNDDVQGTGAVVAAGFVNGMRAQGTPLDEARVVFYGAGSSAVGVAHSIGLAIDAAIKREREQEQREKRAENAAAASGAAASGAAASGAAASGAAASGAAASGAAASGAAASGAAASGAAASGAAASGAAASEAVARSASSGELSVSSRAKSAIYLVDSKGLVTTHRGDVLPEHKRPFARGDDVPDARTLLEVVRAVKPHALIGLSGAGPSWTREVVEECCRHHERPLVFPLSNPTSRAEISAQDAVAFSDGRALFAAGSPFEPVQWRGRTVVPGQANNVFVFPGIGFGAFLSGATAVTDDMLSAASVAVAEAVEPADLERGKLYPSIDRLRDVSFRVAARVAEAAFRQGVAERIDAEPEEGWMAWVENQAWWPDESSKAKAKKMNQ